MSQISKPKPKQKPNPKSKEEPGQNSAKLRPTDRLGIGEVAQRTGLAVSAIRYYETQGLITPVRNLGGQRRYLRSDIRRLSFVLIAQQLGFTLQDIKQALQTLPKERTPTARDWSRISKAFRADLDTRINMLTRMRDRLDGCIGCGCLSLKRCELYNPQDVVQERGAGPRLVLDDDSN